MIQTIHEVSLLADGTFGVGFSYSNTNNLTFELLIDKYAGNNETKFQLQYYDYEKDTWTIPVLLTKERAYRIKNDFSISKIRIINGSDVFEIKP